MCRGATTGTIYTRTQGLRSLGAIMSQTAAAHCPVTRLIRLMGHQASRHLTRPVPSPMWRKRARVVWRAPWLDG